VIGLVGTILVGIRLVGRGGGGGVGVVGNDVTLVGGVRSVVGIVGVGTGGTTVVGTVTVLGTIVGVVM
jgi:hypothetical protein